MRLIGGLIDRTIRLAKRISREPITPQTYQEQTLRRLLKTAQATAFGTHYHFDGILRSRNFVDTFQAIIPFSDYDSMYQKWWYRSVETEEEDVTWPGKIKYFALSSGTTGTPSKYIPVSKQMIRAMQRAGTKCFFQMFRFGVHSDFFLRDMIMLGGSTSLVREGGYFVGDLSGINISKTPFWLRLTSKPGKEIAAIPDWNQRLEKIAIEAPNWDVSSITGNPAWNRLMIQRILEYHKADNIHQIWPNLQAFAHGGVAFEPYRASFDALLGKPIHYIETYLASEGFIGYQTQPNARTMSLVLSGGIFFEFLPFNDQNFDADGHIIGHPRALTVAQVQPDCDYALVISTCAGAWRYLIGDTVRFKNVGTAEIVITGRTKQYLSICGEHISVGNMNQAVQHLQETLGVVVTEFTVCAIPHQNGFLHKWYIAADQAIDIAAAARIIDQELCRVNDDYRVERSALLSIEVAAALPTHVFYDYMEAIGKIGNQHKFPRVMKQKQLEHWEAFLQSKQASQR